MLKHLLLLFFLLGTLPLVQAHDPGLSRATVELGNTSLVVSMVFARQDLEILETLDRNLDGEVTTTEFLAAQSSLHSIFTTGVVVRKKSEIILPTLVWAELVADDAIQIEMSYRYSQLASIYIQVSLLEQLSRGHRQYLVVQDAQEALLSQYILKANSPPFLVQTTDANEIEVFANFVNEGVWHIWFGLDHVLFLLTLLLPAVLIYRQSRWVGQKNIGPAIKDILKVVTAFTLAHSITLALAVFDIVTPPSRLVELVIAFSVLVTALNNLRPIFPTSRWMLAFGFGLIHGFGFASALLKLDLPTDALLLSLLGFNLGVEAGQLVIVFLVFPMINALRHTGLYRNWIFRGGSTAAAVIAGVWMVERIFVPF